MIEPLNTDKERIEEALKMIDRKIEVYEHYDSVFATFDARQAVKDLEDIKMIIKYVFRVSRVIRDEYGMEDVRRKMDSSSTYNPS